MPKRAVLYARVSTSDQADRGFSLPNQIDNCRLYAQNLGYEIVAEMEEDHSGGTPIAERPKSKFLAEMFKGGKADALIAHKLDRLSRDDLDLRQNIRQWIKDGIEIHTCDDGKIESDSAIAVVIKSWVSADEREKIRIRTMAGKQKKAKLGQIVVCGRPPYGYDFVRDAKGRVSNFVIVESERRIVRLIFTWYAYGDGSGKPLSLRAIAARLSEIRVPSPSESSVRQGYTVIKKPGIWTACQIWAMLQKEVYAGVWYYGGRIGNSRKMRPVSERIAVEVPAIIDRDLWEATQERRRFNTRLSAHPRRDYLLRSLVKCDCGLTMVGNFFSNHRYYTCGWRHNHHPKIEQRTCWAKSARADVLELEIWDAFKDQFSDLDAFWDRLKEAQALALAKQEPKRDELKEIESKIREADREVKAVALALRKAKGRVSETLEAEQDAVNARHAELTRQKALIEAELEKPCLTDEALDNIIQFVSDVRTGFEGATHDDMRQHLLDLALEVKVKNGQYWAKSLLTEWDGIIPKAVRNAGALSLSC